MQQGSGSFWDFGVKVQSKNALLCDTESFLNKDQLHHRIESGMTPKLTLCCRHEKSNKITNFKKWLVDVRRIDDLMRSDRAKLEMRRNKKLVAAIMQPTDDNSASLSTAPVAAIMGSSSSAVAYMPSNDNNVLEGDDTDSDDTVSPLFTTPPHYELCRRLCADGTAR
ncbi:hypothetical protein PILCRDRAFT_11263 [Piloderma croceum F 1598]|uniref:Uncharacterized protein n=1 Tax=Piloderma croceum (strain F 1598) TaxID=765440 RepID=A0A0C3FEA3_PILCF|nr:hypothetical protein PILCRDRAFT_11263 [Piloderma croceum F 1598]